jgi:hypothetical protein
MKARLTRDYTPPPEFTQLPYPAGLVVDGDLAKMAIRDGAAVALGPVLETKVEAPLEAKRRGRPPKVSEAA